jgi:hypothetical protein
MSAQHDRKNAARALAKGILAATPSLRPLIVQLTGLDGTDHQLEDHLTHLLSKK